VAVADDADRQSDGQPVICNRLGGSERTRPACDWGSRVGRVLSDPAKWTAVAVVVAAAAIGGSARAAQTPGKRSVMDGVYTTDQAARGRAQYKKRCVLCHLDNGQGHAAVPVIPGESLEREGDAEAPAVAGEPFQKKWNGRTAWELYGTMASTMPVGSPKALSPQEYADLLAFLFELNKFPAGQSELTPAREQLESITIGR
jgi:mono/diheme cytochrome c family protein